jgi:hypothetical protein
VEISGRPGRVPNQPDIVGQELKYLLETVDSTERKSLKKYIALWHKMRASIYIRIGEKLKASKEIKKAILYFPFNFKLLIYIIFLFMSPKLVNNLIKFRRIL